MDSQDQRGKAQSASCQIIPGAQGVRMVQTEERLERQAGPRACPAFQARLRTWSLTLEAMGRTEGHKGN